MDALPGQPITPSKMDYGSGTVWPGGGATGTPPSVLRAIPQVYMDTIPGGCLCSVGYSTARQQWRICWPSARCPCHGSPAAPAPALDSPPPEAEPEPEPERRCAVCRGAMPPAAKRSHVTCGPECRKIRARQRDREGHRKSATA